MGSGPRTGVAHHDLTETMWDFTALAARWPGPILPISYTVTTYKTSTFGDEAFT